MRRQDNITALVNDLKRQMDEMKIKREDFVKSKDVEYKLIDEEVKLLRAEARKNENFWQNQFNSWVVEKNNLQKEIRCLVDGNNDAQSYYTEMTNLLKDEVQLFKMAKDSLNEKTEYMNELETLR